MRSRARRRSISSCVSPGPRVPMPPPSRARCCHMRPAAAACTGAARARPGAATPACGRGARRCRGSAPSDRPRAPRAPSRDCAPGPGVRSSSKSATSALRVAHFSLQLLELALGEKGGGVDAAAALDQLVRPPRRPPCPPGARALRGSRCARRTRGRWRCRRGRPARDEVPRTDGRWVRTSERAAFPEPPGRRLFEGTPESLGTRLVRGQPGFASLTRLAPRQ